MAWTSDSAMILGNCELCDTTCDQYRNCLNKFCNKLFIGCDACVKKTENTYKRECQEIIKDSENMRSPRANMKKRLHRNK